MASPKLSNFAELDQSIAICGAIDSSATAADVAKYESFCTVAPASEGTVPDGLFADKPVVDLPLGAGLYEIAAGVRAAAKMTKLPKPTLCVCKSARRAGAFSLIAIAMDNNWTSDQAIEYAKEHQLTFLGTPAMVEWVRGCIDTAYISASSSPLIFRQLFDPESSTYSYILADSATRQGIIIDPVDTQTERDAQILQELHIHLLYGLNTHVHADHITGTHLLRQQHFPHMRSVISAASGARADVQVQPGDTVRFGSRYVTVRATPGHTGGCVSYVMDDRSRVFTGDALLIRGCGRTDFQGGCSDTLYESVHTQLLQLPNDTAVYPAHDYKGRTASTIAEEREYNPRLSKTLEEFKSIMEGLNLPYPKKIDVAQPANMNCGAESVPE